MHRRGRKRPGKRQNIRILAHKFLLCVLKSFLKGTMSILAREVFKERFSSLTPQARKLFTLSVAWQNERISLIKKECHQYDQEWRMLLPTPYASRPSIKLKPKSILIGLCTPEHKKRLIISAARVAGIQEIYQVIINNENLLTQ